MIPIFRECECGGTIFTMKQTITGFVLFHVGAYGEETDNGAMYEGTRTKDCWKYYRCHDCGRKAKEVD